MHIYELSETTFGLTNGHLVHINLQYACFDIDCLEILKMIHQCSIDYAIFYFVTFSFRIFQSNQ